jgi:hypothetical protein
MADALMSMLRDWQDHCRLHDRQPEAAAFKGAIAEIERLRAALKPFARIELWRDTYPDAKFDRVMTCPCVVEQIKAARVALGDEQTADETK